MFHTDHALCGFDKTQPSSRTGSHFIISLFIAAFIAVDRIGGIFEQKTERGGISTMTAVFILSLPVLLTAPSEVHFTKAFLKNLPKIEKQTKGDIAFVAKYPEPVMCENPALSYWAEKKLSFDFFTTVQKLKTGSMPEENITDRLDNKEFSLIQLNDEKGNMIICLAQHEVKNK